MLNVASVEHEHLDPLSNRKLDQRTAFRSSGSATLSILRGTEFSSPMLYDCTSRSTTFGSQEGRFTH